MSAGSASSPNTIDGNWVVSGTEVNQSETIVLNGNLTVQSGGNLTLRNVTLSINSQYTGEYGILVQPGGSLYIYNSNITASNLADRYIFVVNGNNFVIENSKVHGVGSCNNVLVTNNLNNCFPFGQENHQFTVTTAGLVVETDDALIEDSLFSQNAIGLIVGGSGVTLKGNIFQFNDYSAFGLFDTSNDLITNNTFEQNPANANLRIVSLGNANDSLIEYNTLLTENLSGVPPISWVQGAFGPQSRCDGVFSISSYSNTIAHNNITAQNIAVALLNSSGNNTILDNILIGGEDGVNGGDGGVPVDSTIESNSITAYADTGITLTLAHGSTVANNSISGDMPLGIQLDHTSNST
ncbi:MAG: right-handed parallel beta-helix repeat-containing protein, partial [Nitrososphaerales archaeon]